MLRLLPEFLYSYAQFGLDLSQELRLHITRMLCLQFCRDLNRGEHARTNVRIDNTDSTALAISFRISWVLLLDRRWCAFSLLWVQSTLSHSLRSHTLGRVTACNKIIKRLSKCIRDRCGDVNETWYVPCVTYSYILFRIRNKFSPSPNELFSLCRCCCFVSYISFFLIFWWIFHACLSAPHLRFAIRFAVFCHRNTNFAQQTSSIGLCRSSQIDRLLASARHKSQSNVCLCVLSFGVKWMNLSCPPGIAFTVTRSIDGTRRATKSMERDFCFFVFRFRVTIYASLMKRWVDRWFTIQQQQKTHFV